MNEQEGTMANVEHYKAMESALRERGVRITRQRQAILSVLAEAEDHPDANELLVRASAIDPSVSLSTIYRTLTVLEENGVVQRLNFEGVPAKFETTDAPHHDHIIDIETGDVIEFRSDKIEKLQAEIAAELGYEIVHHRLDLYAKRLNKTN
ncbi:MAG: Fur family transcriptional regulator [Pseudomonadota bacterium]